MLRNVKLYMYFLYNNFYVDIIDIFIFDTNFQIFMTVMEYWLKIG